MWIKWMGAMLSVALLMAPADLLAAGRGTRSAAAKKRTTTSKKRTATTSTRKTASKKSTSLRRDTKKKSSGVAKLTSTDAATLSPLRLEWSTRWSSGQNNGVTRVQKSRATAKVGNADQSAVVYTGTEGAETIGQLTFEPLAGGQHRVLLGHARARYEVLPARKSDGAAKEGERAGNYRVLNQRGTRGRVNTVEFFKAKGRGGKLRYFAAYGEEGLTAPRRKTTQTLTHVVDITGKKVVSLPYNFISIWNGSGNDGMVLVEPLNRDGTPRTGEVLGIPLGDLAKSFDRTVSDPSKWTKVL